MVCIPSVSLPLWLLRLPRLLGLLLSLRMLCLRLGLLRLRRLLRGLLSLGMLTWRRLWLLCGSFGSCIPCGRWGYSPLGWSGCWSCPGFGPGCCRCGRRSCFACGCLSRSRFLNLLLSLGPLSLRLRLLMLSGLLSRFPLCVLGLLWSCGVLR